MKLKYGKIPSGAMRYGADDGIVNVCLGKRYATIAKKLCVAELVTQRTLRAIEAKHEQATHR